MNIITEWWGRRTRTSARRSAHGPRGATADRSGEFVDPRRVAMLAVAVVAVVAAVVSYAHMQQLAAEAGEGWRSHLLPLSVDGLLIAAAMSMVVARLHGGRPSPLAWIALTLGIVASLAANVAAAEPTLVGRLVAGWSPLALALAFELLMQQIRRTRPDATATPAVPGARRADKPEDTTTADPTPAARAPRRAPETAPKSPVKRAARSIAGGRAPGAQARARAVYERAVADGRDDDLTGAVLAREVGASPGAARKWLAAFRAEQHTTATSGARDDRDGVTEAPRLAVVGESYPGGDA